MGAGPVIVGYDGSEITGRALREAAAVLRPREVLIVTVWEPGIAFGPWAGIDVAAVPIDAASAAMVDEALYEQARATAGRGAEAARGLGLEATPLVVADERTVGATLVRLAAERDAAAIVVGAHRYGRVERIFLGSTSRSVVEHAPCPVLVVRGEDPD